MTHSEISKMDYHHSFSTFANYCEKQLMNISGVMGAKNRNTFRINMQDKTLNQ